MNLSIYAAFSRMELGAAVTVEFCGPLVLAAVLSKRPRTRSPSCWPAVGVVLVSGHQWADIFRPAVVFALWPAAMWASYILLAARVSTLMPRLDGLADRDGVRHRDRRPGRPRPARTGPRHSPHVLAVGLAVAVMSSVLPYSLELLALRRMPPHVFGVLQSTEPALAALAGWLVLSQRLTLTQGLGVGGRHRSVGAGDASISSRQPGAAGIRIELASLRPDGRPAALPSPQSAWQGGRRCRPSVARAIID